VFRFTSHPRLFPLQGEQFEIISLTGTLLPGNNGSKRMGSWTVTLGGGPKAKIWGGVVADKLIAASVVKVLFSNDRQIMLIEFHF
jgi:hypothetical protein